MYKTVMLLRGMLYHTRNGANSQMVFTETKWEVWGLEAGGLFFSLAISRHCESRVPS